MAILLSMVKFPALDICKGRKKRTGKLSAKHRKYTAWNGGGGTGRRERGAPFNPSTRERCWWVHLPGHAHPCKCR